MVAGNITKDQMFADFKAKVRDAFPNLEVE